MPDSETIDVTLPGLQTKLLHGAINSLLASPSCNTVVMIFGSQGLAMPDLMASAIHDSL